jgi:hypothetical protein
MGQRIHGWLNQVVKGSDRNELVAVSPAEGGFQIQSSALPTQARSVSDMPTLRPLISFQASNASVQRRESSSVRCNTLGFTAS